MSNEAIELCKIDIDYNRIFECMGKKEADSCLFYWMEGRKSNESQISELKKKAKPRPRMEKLQYQIRELTKSLINAKELLDNASPIWRDDSPKHQQWYLERDEILNNYQNEQND